MFLENKSSVWRFNPWENNSISTTAVTLHMSQSDTSGKPTWPDDGLVADKSGERKRQNGRPLSHPSHKLR